MASGVPVVTTSIGIEGIEATDGTDVLIRDNPEEIAKAVVDILEDKNLYKKLAQNARKLIENLYDWRELAFGLDKIYQEVGNAIQRLARRDATHPGRHSVVLANQRNVAKFGFHRQITSLK